MVESKQSSQSRQFKVHWKLFITQNANAIWPIENSKTNEDRSIQPPTHTNPKQKALICVCVCVLCRVVEKLVDAVRYAVYVHIPWFSLILLLLLIYQFFNSANSVAVDVDVHCTATSHRFIFVLCSTVLSFVLPVLLFSFYPFVCSLSQIRFSFSSPYRRCCCCCCWHYWFSTFSTVAETFYPISSSIPSIPNTHILVSFFGRTAIAPW